MSQQSSTLEPRDGLAFIEEAICAGLKRLLNQAFGSPTFTVKPGAPPVLSEDLVWFTFDLLPAQFGSVSFGLAHASAISIGYRLLEAKRRASEHEHHALHAIRHLLNQLAASLAESLSGGLNVQLQCQESTVAAPAASCDNFAVEFASDEHGSHFLSCAVSAADAKIFENMASAASATAVAPESALAVQNLGLLLDLEMPVTVSFGATRLALNEIAKLTTGSIVELNRTVAEPVEIVVNNCSIARGEVVVVEGNFAVRIKQIMSRQDRLRSLG